MTPLRIMFEKKGRAKYISHLDMSKCMQRAFKRADLPIWYTEGFNPHMYLTFALPLSLGYESCGEFMDVRVVQPITNEDFITRFNAVLPEGIKALKAFTPKNKPEKICCAKYTITLHFDAPLANSPTECLEKFVQLETIEVMKKTKKSEKLIDIKPHFTIENCENIELGVKFDTIITSGINLNINPSLIIDSFCKTYGFNLSYSDIIRLTILTPDGVFE